MTEFPQQSIDSAPELTYEGRVRHRFRTDVEGAMASAPRVGEAYELCERSEAKLSRTKAQRVRVE